MVCSACGYENQAVMRFCGMCGTPLPHRPLTTPGAQSTLNYTRVPVESAPVDTEHGSGIRSASLPSTRSISPGNGSSATTSDLHGSTESLTHHPVTVANEHPAKELVPDVSLDEYVQHFHYEPPVDPSEVTMRGDVAPVVEPENTPANSPASDATAATDDVASESVSEEPIDEEELAFRHKVEAALRHTPAKAPADSKPEPKIETPVPADSVADRLGLEPESPAEERVQRPRFLDINEPARESKPVVSSGTSSIVGPSFLGLSDAPLIAAESFPPEEESADSAGGSHWRVWIALAIVAIFVVLGIVQWRAQASQNGNGPIQALKAKIDSWRHGAAKPSSGDVIPPATDANSASSAQTQAPQQSASQVPAPTATNNSSTKPRSTTAQEKPPISAPPPSATGKQSSATVPKPTASDNAQSPATISNSESGTPAEKQPASQGTTASGAANDTTQPAAAAAGDNPKPARRSDTGAKQAASGLTAAGAEEMSKAKNASDAAASAAWLWKATAKGNPDAPVQLADMYIKGTGVPRSCEQAMVLLKTAAAKENALARNRLASMYATGNCVQRNRVEAYRWLIAALAANPTSQWAQQNRELIWNQMTPEEQAAAQKYR